MESRFKKLQQFLAIIWLFRFQTRTIRKKKNEI